MMNDLKPLIKRFMIFAKTNLNFKRPPRLFLKKDKANSECMLGKTAHYDPQASSVTLYISGRHPKDILRSLGHELVHHCQNERGDLAPEKMKTMNKNYAQENDHMRKMEKEAYLMGNMCFRDWEDGLDDKLQYKMQIAERKFLKENKNMSVKISKKDLKKIIGRLLSEHESSGDCPEDKRDADGNCPAETGEGEGDGALAEGEGSECDACNTGSGDHTCGELMQEEDGDDDQDEPGTHDEDGDDDQDEPGTHDEDDAYSKEAPDVPGGAANGGLTHKPGKPKTGGTTEAGKPKTGGTTEAGKPKTGGTTEAGKPKTGGTTEAGKEEFDGEEYSRELSKAADKEREANESRIRTPEEEKTLYEARFTNRNTKLFEKLVKQWTK